jgi:NAD(P)-dependent dehydrogenase (short-subunit alcohol dehydrogenase family)
VSRTVVVTGASRGIGRAVVARFAALGDEVLALGRDEAALAALGDGVRPVVCDVTDEGAVAAAFAQAGEVDVLVNNAGIAGPTALVEDVDPEAWRDCLAVGLDSHFLMARAVVPHLKRQRSGAIVTISSTAGLYGYGMRTPYAAAKWAVIGFTKSLAVELGPYGVRANVVAPGSVEGPRMGRVIEAEAAQRGVSTEAVEREYVAGQSIPRFAKPTEIAEVCAFLASPAASMVNGQVIAVDGHTETFHIGTR